jgi:hypothetical protein
MFVIAPATLANRAALGFRQVPRRFLGRAFVWPRVEGGWRLKARIIFEIELLRYLVALAPFAFSALIWRDNALAIAQAPLLMILVVYGVEMRFLRLSPAAKRALMAPGERDRGLDTLTARGRALLTRIAAGRGLAEGRLHLVVEQSDMARVAPLTLVSVQRDGVEGHPAFLDLDAEERARLRDELFAPPLTEAEMHRITLAGEETVHTVTLELRTIPAHARMAALTGIG